MTHWLNYHHLYYFRTIATEGGIANASKKLRLGQPTLSTQLKQLEESLGQKLFERKNRRLVLTEAGRVALNYSNEIFKMGNEMVEAIHDRLSKNRIHVQIGALDSIPKAIIQNLVLAAYQTGVCSVSILEGKGDELLRELNAHRLDLLLTNFPAPVTEEKGIVSRRIASLDVIVCGSKDSKNLKANFPQSLDGQSFILPTAHSKLRHDMDHFFKINGISPDIVAETQDTAVQKLLGTAGVGLIPIAEAAARELIEEKKLVSLGTLSNISEEVWLVAATRKIENPIASKLMKSYEFKVS
ncbi:MAG: LysR family transcriptional regulator [Bdellovibrionales bacterium]|nr:LysR family transcriptional regulator [Bdellovibrionales bacterium]